MEVVRPFSLDIEAMVALLACLGCLGGGAKACKLASGVAHTESRKGFSVLVSSLFSFLLQCSS